MIIDDLKAARDALTTPPRTDGAAQRKRMERAYQENKAKTWALIVATWAVFLAITLETGGAF